MARHLGLQAPLCHRILAAATRPADAADTLSTIPGLTGLEMFIEACGRIGVSSERVEAASAAVAEFGNLIRRFGGSQRKLIDAVSAAGIGSGRISTARKATELREVTHRQAVDLYGSNTETSLSIRIYRPSMTEPGQLDMHGVMGRIGFQRRNASLPIVMFHGGAALSRAGREHPTGDADFLEQFRSKPLPRTTFESRDNVEIEIVDPNLEVHEPMDYLAGPFTANSSLMTLNGRRFLNSSTNCVTPSRQMLADVYLPAATVASLTCSAGAFRAGPLGSILGDPSLRWFDRIPGSLTPNLLGRGLANCATEAYARHEDLTMHFFDAVGLDADQYVGFRLEVLYPLLHISYVLSFETAPSISTSPSAPSTPSTASGPSTPSTRSVTEK